MRREIIAKGLLFHQDNALAHSSVVAMAPVVPESLMGRDLVKKVGKELVVRHSPEWLQWKQL